MVHIVESADNNFDDRVDEQIRTCLKLENPSSFFLFAGAGSGKTRSLINALDFLRAENGLKLRLRSQKIGVITYTNAACDEIKQRLDSDPIVEVSTIHSFIWSLIGNFNSEIKQWLSLNLQREIEELREKQKTGRSGTKAAIDRDNSIIAKTERLARLANIRGFTYSPNGDNHGFNSLNHSEVIEIGAYFLSDKLLMQDILACKFPILLIDESQDTNKRLMDAFLKVQSRLKKSFILGLFGDTMQRIYSDGKIDLGQNLPTDWVKPTKVMNHRCPRRVITLINKIRATVDEQEQKTRTDKEEGFVRLYILPNHSIDRLQAEQEIARRMLEVTSDPDWVNPSESVKTLILEHHMAAKRLGFLEMYEPLSKSEKLRTGLLNGKLPGIRLFASLILPLVTAINNGDNFTATSIVRKNSPLLSKATLKAAGDRQTIQLEKAKGAIEQLMRLWENDSEPSFLDVLYVVDQTKLFEIPDSLKPIVARNKNQQRTVAEKMVNNVLSLEEDENEELDTWDRFLLTSFSQIEPYIRYITQRANFDTHQGVKGREFPRVMVIMDDSDAKGFLFTYEKLFGAKDITKTDKDNELAGKDTSIDRTRRLFYVTCSRAEKSLALVAYSENPEKVRDYVISQGWFDNHEVEVLLQ